MSIDALKAARAGLAEAAANAAAVAAKHADLLEQVDSVIAAAEADATRPTTVADVKAVVARLG